MGFLSRKHKDFTDQFESAVTPAEKALWIKTVSQRNLLTHWGEALLRVEELFTETVLYYPEKQPDVLKFLKKLEAEWLKADRKLVTVEEAIVLYDVLHKEIPALIYRFGLLKSTRASSEKNHEDDYFEVQKKLEQLMSAVLTVRAKVDAQKLSRFKDLNPGSASNQLSRLTWPVYADMPEDVSAKLADLGVIWNSQRENVHTIEDEYLLERIVTDYIPSSLQLYAPFISAKMEVETAARTALLGQLQLIQDHLEELSARNLKEHMRTVNAQTEFLKDRFNNS
jgi:hypothetical protein